MVTALAVSAAALYAVAVLWAAFGPLPDWLRRLDIYVRKAA